MPRFDKVGKCFDLKPERRYEPPQDIEVTHIGLKNGKVAFFRSPDGENVYKSGNKWLFMKIPEGARSFIFPNARRTVGGWDYGINLAV